MRNLHSRLHTYVCRYVLQNVCIHVHTHIYIRAPPGTFYIKPISGPERPRERGVHTYVHRPLWASLGLSVRLRASLRLSGLLWASLAGPLWASWGLSGPLWASLGLSGPLYIHREDKTITDSWSPSFPRCPKLPDNNTTQYPTAGAPVSFEAQNGKTKRPDNTRLLERGPKLLDKKPDNAYPTAGTPASFECHFLIKLSSFRSHPRTVRTVNQISHISQMGHVSRMKGNGRSRHLALALIVHASLPTF